MPSLFPVGRLNGITAAVGTILGPDSAGEYLVVSEIDDAGVKVSYATVNDIREAADRMVAGESARSITEHRIWLTRRDGAA